MEAKEIDRLRADALGRFERQVSTIYFSGGRTPIISTSMVVQAVQAAEDNVSELVKTLVSQALKVALGNSSFLPITDAIRAHLNDLERVIEHGVVSLHSSALFVTIDLFKGVRNHATELLERHRPAFAEPKNPGGRLANWAWEEALCHIVAVANTPNGIETGHGFQARIEKEMAEWFMAVGGDHPAVSGIRQRAQMVVKATKALKKDGN
jgi:hypothetical protein